MAVRAHSEKLRRDGYRAIASHINERFGLRDNLELEAAVDILLTLGGGSTYRQLVLDYGWTHDRFVAWLAGTLTECLLDEPA